jgi:hypothetical protein
MSTSVVIDSDIQAVVEFMQTRIAASRLVAVAGGLAAMAPLLWGHYKTEAVQAVRLEPHAITAGAARTPPSANE